MINDNDSQIIANNIIQQAYQTKNPMLKLNDLGLRSLPDRLWELSFITHLEIKNNHIEELPKEISLLTNLSYLDMRDNLLTFLPNELENLQDLKLLIMINNKLLEVPSVIFKLKKLEALDLSWNKIVDVPSQIKELINLRILLLEGNKLTNLSPQIGELTNLENLELSSNLLSKLPIEIANLKKLARIDVSFNHLVSIPIIEVKNKRDFVIMGNLPPIPPEIIQNGISAISNFLANVSGDSKKLNEAKMLIVGQGSVGKTSLASRLISNQYVQNQKKTDGISISKWNLLTEEKDVIQINVWDFGGQEIMHATHQFFLTKRSLYLLVLDSRLTQEENRVEYWLKIIESFGGDSPVLIIGNKIEQHPLDIDRTGLQKKYPNVVGIFETSAAKGQGIGELKKAINQHVSALPHIHDLLPETWFKLKSNLEELGHKQNYITQDSYLALCAENKVHDEISQRTLIAFLHDLGVVLHFQDDPRLESLGILNPQWVTNGVYKILNSHDLFQNKGVLEHEMLDRILDLPEYPRGKRLFIVDMMRKFELCYDIEAEKTFLVPDLLPKDEPYTGEWNNTLAFQYHYNVLPSSITSRFIVRMNAHIYKTVWRSGVVLQMGGNTALVKADVEEKKIFIWVNGDEPTRRDLLSAIRAEFEAIHKTIVKIEVREKVPVPTHPEIVVDYEHLLNLERLGETTFIPEGLRERVNVRELLNGIAPESERQERTKKLHEIAPPPEMMLSEKPASALAKPHQHSRFLVAIRHIIALPKPIGRFVFDVSGRHDSADTSAIIMGWIFVAFIILLFQGIIQMDAVVNIFKDIWRFFFPVE